ncbi:MAG: polyprenyl synthetase family protein [Elusimicrobiota bacterium]
MKYISIEEVKNIIEKEISKYIKNINREYKLQKDYPRLYTILKDFLNRESKLVRPILLTMSYLANGGDPSSGIYGCSTGLELLHTCALIHDDIIDRSDLRRGGPSVHNMFNEYKEPDKSGGKKGEDFAIVTGDMLYGLGLKKFTDIKTEPDLILRALRKVMDTAAKTSLGELNELFYSMESIKDVTKKELLKMYDYKSGFYTFSSPLAAGAILAGYEGKKIRQLEKLGLYLGRAFQIKDDLEDTETENNSRYRFEDIKKKRVTYLIWIFYKKASKNQLQKLDALMKKDEFSENDCLEIYRMYKDNKILRASEKEKKDNFSKAKKILKKIEMDNSFKRELTEYCKVLLKI